MMQIQYTWLSPQSIFISSKVYQFLDEFLLQSRQVVLACLVALTAASPQFRQFSGENPRHIAVLRDNRVDHGDGNFQFEYETENGIYKSVVGRPGPSGGQTMDGSFRWEFILSFRRSVLSWVYLLRLMVDAPFL